MGGKQTKEKDQKDSKEKNNTNDTTEKNNAILNEEKCGGWCSGYFPIFKR